MIKILKNIKTNYPLVNLVVGVALLFIIISLVTFAPLFTKYDPLEQNSEVRLEKPNAAHLFGTDRFGRDVFSRTLFGGRTTLLSAFLSLGIALAIGLLAGLTTGFYSGSIFDIICMRVMDVLLSFPFMVLAMVIASLFGAGLFQLLIAVVFVWWVPFARLGRSIVFQAKSEASIAAARVLGARHRVIMIQELLPKVISPVFIQATFELGTLILSISALSFLGLGAQPPNPEWGSMLSDGRAHFMLAPHILLGPTLFIIVTVLALNLIGEGLRDMLDPIEIPKI
jgi:peptide/nickel transport system permease protein